MGSTSSYRTIIKPHNNASVKARTDNQAKYIDDIRTSSITFGIGSAGSGKTFLSIATALELLHENKCEKIIITRPVVEAGEHLGFLPGDMIEKTLPYLIPLYDALDSFLGKQRRENYITNSKIEILPLAYMRGRDLKDSVIILDEAQNTTLSQLKMALTRLGKGSKIVVNGDPTQNDLPHYLDSGLMTAVEILEGVESVSVATFSEEDVQRAKIVRKVIKAFREYENRD